MDRHLFLHGYAGHRHLFPEPGLPIRPQSAGTARKHRFKTGTATVTLAAGDSSATADLSFERVQADKNGTPTADIQQASFNTPVTVKAGETFTLTVNAKAPNTGAPSWGFPNWPSTDSAGAGHSLLGLLGLAALLLRRRV